MTLPLKLDEDVEQGLTNWLLEELTIAQLELGDRDARAVKYDQMYGAEPEQAIKTFPWYKASNLVAPLAGIIIDAVYSRLINTLWAADPFWTLRGRRGEWVELAESAQQFLDYIQNERMHAYFYLKMWVMELTKMGISSFGLPWRTIKRRNVNDSGQVKENITYDGPVIELIPWTDLFYRGLPTVLKDADWKGYRVRYSWTELKRWEASGWLENVDRIKGAAKGYYEAVQQEARKMHGGDSINPEFYELYNIQCSYDIDGCGYPEELHVVFEPQTPALLYVSGNPYTHGECTIHTGTYFPKEHNLAGYGICQMLEPLQAAMTTMLNQTIDNATAANTVFIKARKGSGVKAGTRIYPMKVFELQDLNDISFESFGQNNAGMFNLIGMVKDFGEKRVGVSDYNMGRESSGAAYAATATSTLALLNESSRRFDTVMKDLRFTLGKVGMQTLQLYSQFKPKGADYEVLEEASKTNVKQLMKFPTGMMRDKVVLEVTASSTARSKPIEQQMYGQYFQMLLGYYTQMVQGLQLAMNPQVPAGIREFAEEAAKGATQVMRKITSTFDIKDVDKYLPNMDLVFNIAVQEEQMKIQQAQQMQQMQMLQQMQGQQDGGQPMLPGMPPPTNGMEGGMSNESNPGEAGPGAGMAG